MEMRFRKPVREFLLPDIIDGEGDIVPIIADGEDGDLEDIDVPDSIPILSLRNTVLFPGVVGSADQGSISYRQNSGNSCPERSRYR
jgi:ATP-dependent Lon protease